MLTDLVSMRLSADIIEEIIAEEIVDEFDRYEDNHSKRMAKRKGTAEVMKGYVQLVFPMCMPFS